MNVTPLDLQTSVQKEIGGYQPNGHKPISEIVETLEADPISNEVLISQSFEFDPAKPSLVIVIGPSGAGKDTISLPATSEEGFGRAVTATTRGRRYEFKQELIKKSLIDGGIQLAIANYEDLINSKRGVERARYITELINLGWLDSKATEPEDAYVWMRARRPDETDKTYHQNLISEYGLVESDHHHGNFYGLPEASLLAANQGGKIPIVRTESQGALTITEKLSSKYNLLIVGIMPDSYEIIWGFINQREFPQKRFEESVQMVETLPQIANYILLNRWGRQEQSIAIFKQLINRAVNR